MSLYGRLMYARERRLTLRDKNRRVFPFEWGLKWLLREATRLPLQELKDYAARSVANSREFLPRSDNRCQGGGWVSDFFNSQADALRFQQSGELQAL